MTRKKEFACGRLFNLSRRKFCVASVPKNATNSSGVTTPKIGDTRLDLLEGEIDHLHVARGLLGKYDAEVGHRDPILFDGLAMQIPDRNTATEQGDDAEGDANCPEAAARMDAAAAGRCCAGLGLHLVVLQLRAPASNRRTIA